MLTFAEFHSAVGAWSRRNFPNNTPDDPFEGLVEELGELAHARLKARQGIRGTPEEHLAAERDAIGDIAIYLADWCERNGFGIADGLTRCFDDPTDCQTFADLDAASRKALVALPERTHDEAFRMLVGLVGEIALKSEALDEGSHGQEINGAGQAFRRHAQEIPQLRGQDPEWERLGRLRFVQLRQFPS